MSADRAVMLAIQAAGRFDDEWETRVHMAVPIVAAMLRQQSEAITVANEMLTAFPIFGVYQGKTFEESSQRMIVSYIADNNGETETLRTRRTDESAGAAMAIRLVSLQPGDRCIFFRYQDEVNRKMSVRMLAGFERLPHKNVRVTTPPQRPHEPGAERPTARATHSPPVEAPVPNPNKPKVLRAVLDALDTEHKLAAVVLLQKHGWQGVDDIPDDEFERAMYIIRHGKEPF